MDSWFIIIALLIMLFLTTVVLGLVVYMLVRMITLDNDSKTYLLTRLFLAYGEEEGLTLEEQQYFQNIINKDVKQVSKGFNPHEEFNKLKDQEQFDPDDFDI